MFFDLGLHCGLEPWRSTRGERRQGQTAADMEEITFFFTFQICLNNNNKMAVGDETEANLIYGLELQVWKYCQSVLYNTYLQFW